MKREHGIDSWLLVNSMAEALGGKTVLHVCPKGREQALWTHAVELNVVHRLGGTLNRQDMSISFPGAGLLRIKSA